MTSFLSTSLNDLLNRELALGNHVVDDGPGWGSMKRLVMLQFPFRSSPLSWPANLSYRDVNDPHYWKTEVVDRITMEMLVCRFD